MLAPSKKPAQGLPRTTTHTPDALVAECNRLVRPPHTFFVFGEKVAFIGAAFLREEMPAGAFGAALKRAQVEIPPFARELIPTRARQILGRPITVTERVNIFSARTCREPELCALLVRYLSIDIPGSALSASDLSRLRLVVERRQSGAWDRLHAATAMARAGVAGKFTTSAAKNKIMDTFLAKTEKILLAS